MPGFLGLTSSLLQAPGRLSLTLLPSTHTLGLLIAAGRPYISSTAPDRLVAARLAVICTPVCASANFSGGATTCRCPRQTSWRAVGLEQCQGLSSLACTQRYCPRAPARRLWAELVELGASRSSAFFCSPILPPGGEPPALGALLLEFPSREAVSPA